LRHGFDPANFPAGGPEGLDGSAHFGNLRRTEDFARGHGDTHHVGIRVDVPTSFLGREGVDVISDMMEGQTEYIVSRDLFPVFNTFPRLPWIPGK
jgi:hypothetical protein